MRRQGRILHEAWAEFDTGLRQRRPLTTIEVRNIEFDAVIRIAALLGLELRSGQLEMTRLGG